MAFPTHVRVVALLLALFVAFNTVSAGAANLLDVPILGVTQLVVGALFVGVFVWVAAWPDHADGVLRERWGWDLSDGRTFGGVLIHVVFVYLIFAGTVLETARGLSQLLETGQHPIGELTLTDQQIVLNLVLNFVLFSVAAVTWLMLVNKHGVRGVVDALRLRWEGFPKGIVVGALAAVGAILVFGAFVFALQYLGYQPRNPQAEAITEVLTLETALLVALLASLGEEVYFRGFLLERVGNWGQAALFALVHATYLVPLQVVLPFALGLLFGWLTRRTSLWSVIVAHFGFNAIMLVGALYGDELAAFVPVVG